MRFLASVLAAALASIPSAAVPALPAGAAAPDFTTSGALAGRPFRLHLREQLRHGPVVLYFYPRAFTEGCTLEARAFSEAARDFRRAGARVIGMSADDYEHAAPLLGRGAAATPSRSPPRRPETIRAYDVRLREGAPMTNRTSYVIAPNGRIIYAYHRPRLAQPRRQHAGGGAGMAGAAAAAAALGPGAAWATASGSTRAGWGRSGPNSPAPICRR